MSSTKLQVSDLERELTSLKTSSEAALKKWEEKWSVKESAALAKGYSEGLLQGVRLYQQRLFLTSAGQEFLREIHSGLIEAYKRSKLYVHDMGAHIGHFVKSGFKAAQGQFTTQGFKGKFDLKACLSGLTPSPHWKGDIDEAVDHPFWLPVMKSAAQKLSSREDWLPPFSPSPEIFYDVALAMTSSTTTDFSLVVTVSCPPSSSSVPGTSDPLSPLSSIIETPAPTLEDVNSSSSDPIIA